MKRRTRILALLLCALTLIPTTLSCGKSVPQKETEQTSAETIEIFKDRKSSYTLVIDENPSDDYKKALETLQNAFEDKFKTKLECISIESNNASDYETESSKAIFLGNIDTTHPAVEKAKNMLQGSGFSAATDGQSLALYSDNDRCLRDLCELFASKYIKNEDGSLLIDSDLSLVRPFTGYQAIDGNEYDFTLPVISIETLGNAPILSVRKYLPAHVTVTNTYDEYAMENVFAEVRGRGNGSWTYSEKKKPIKLKFSSKVNLLGAGGGNSRDWALLSNPFDYTQLRNSITFTLARNVFDNIDYCTGFRHANLFISGEYAGIYLICEQMESASHKIDIEENTESPELSDYLIELDSYAASTLDTNVKDTDYFQLEDKYWLIKSDYNTPERCDYVKRRMMKIFQIIRTGNQSSIEAFIDMESCIDMYLLHEYAKNTDVGWSSFYIILRADGKLEFTAPWDFDLSSGNDIRIDDGSYKGLHAADRDYPGLDNPLFYLLMEHRFFVNLVAKRWSEISAKAKETVMEHIEYFTDEYASEFIYDCENNYPKESVHKFSSAADGAEVYYDNIEYLTEWYVKRTEWMDFYFGMYNT